MTRYSAPKSCDLSVPPHTDPRRPRPAVAATTQLSAMEGLVMALLLSLALWSAIWLTASRLVSLWN
jgi:hypothetical protein